MEKGVKVILCVIALVLIMIAEKGIPVKLGKFDVIIYGIVFIAFCMTTGSF